MTTITLHSAEEVMARVRKDLGHLLSTGKATVTKSSGKAGGTPWVWFASQEKLTPGTPENAAIKAIGFRWSKKRGQWYHTCEDKRAWTPRRRSNTAPKPTAHEPTQTHSEAPTQPDTPRDSAAPNTTVTDYAKEFERLFGFRP